MFEFCDEQVRAVERAAIDTDGMSDRRPDLDGVVYLLCLEPGAQPAAGTSAFETLLNSVIEAMQPAPSVLHAELCLPPTSDRMDMNFATYLGSTANWGRSFGDPRAFYLGNTASSWRAVPIVAHDAARAVRDECGKHVLTPYSLARYACAVPPLRSVAGLLPDSVGAPAHCATLAARVLRRALPSVGLAHSSGWYGPASLFLDVSSESRRATAHARLHAGAQLVRADGEEAEEVSAIAALLQGDDDAVRALDDAACTMALYHLTMRSLEAGLDDVGRRIVQKQLACALLRVSVVRV
jgi:hypothetical protein